MSNWIKRERVDEMVGFVAFAAFGVGIFVGLGVMALIRWLA